MEVGKGYLFLFLALVGPLNIFLYCLKSTSKISDTTDNLKIEIKVLFTIWSNVSFLS